MSINLENQIIGPLVTYGKNKSGLTVYGKSSQEIDRHTCNFFNYVPLSSNAPTNLNTRNKFIYIIQRDVKGLLRKVYLECVLTNSGSSAIQFIPYYYIFDYILIYFGNQNVRWDNDSIYHYNNLVKTDYEVTGEQVNANLSESTYSYYNGTLAAGASITMRIDISCLIQSMGGALIDGFIEDIRLEFNTNPSSNFLTVATASGANVTCSSWALDLGYELLSDDDYRIRYEACRNHAFLYKYVEPIHHISTFAGLNSNVQYNDTMKDINAKVHGMIFTLRPQSAINENFVTFYPLNLMYIKDASNRIIGDQEWTSNQITQFTLPMVNLNFYLSRVSLTPWIFSRSIINTLAAGVNIGSLYFTGQSESFWFSASGSLSNVNTEMIICAYVETLIKVDGGVTTIERITGY